MNGITSRWVSFKSGVPQGTVLGPLMFLIYINGIGKDVLSMLKLFADDCILYKAISSVEDCNELQNDLNTIANELKSFVLKCSKSTPPISTQYYLDNHTLECVKHHAYLGVILDQTMSSPHIENVVSKTSKILNFIKRNL